MFKIQSKLIAIIGSALLLILLSFYFISERLHKESLERMIHNSVRRSEYAMRVHEKMDTGMLSAALKVFLGNEPFKELFLTKDRERLYEYGQPLFKELMARYGITHFYFHLPEGRTFVRLHNKSIYGDEVNRITFKKARETREFSSGIELGKTAFALRVVAPYYKGNELIGYVELGKEIDHFLDTLKGETKDEFAIIARKEYLGREDWGAVRQAAGLTDNWDDIINYVWVSRTLSNPAATACFSDINIAQFEKGASFIKEFSGENKNYACGGFPIYDAGGKALGTVMTLVDISEQATLINNARRHAAFIFIPISFIIFFLVTLLIRRSVSRPIEKLSKAADIIASGGFDHRVQIRSRDEIGQLGNSMNVMASQIGSYVLNLQGMVDDATRELRESRDELRSMNTELAALYKVSMAISRTIDLQKLLYDILFTVVGLDVFNVEHKGGIFVVDGDKMELVSHIGFSEPFLALHKDTRVGDCLCGLAAKTGEVVVSNDSHEDERHTIRYDGMTHHGHVIVPLKSADKVVGVLCLYLPADIKLDKGKIALLSSIGGQIGIAIENAKLYEQTKELSLHDPLTGLANRRYMEIFLERGFNESRRYGRLLSVIMLDIDHFKKYNDTHGHQAGDKLLQEIAMIINGCVRDTDLVARYGGEEFLILLPEIDLTRASEVSERLRKAVEEKAGVTISLGASSFRQWMEKKEELVHKADEALYRAKQEGRNRVVVAYVET